MRQFSLSLPCLDFPFVNTGRYYTCLVSNASSLSFSFLKIGEFDLVQEATPIVNEQLLKALSLIARSSIPRALVGISKGVDIMRRVTLP